MPIHSTHDSGNYVRTETRVCASLAVLGMQGPLSLTSDMPPQVRLSPRPPQAQGTIQKYSVQVSGVKNRRHSVCINLEGV